MPLINRGEGIRAKFCVAEVRLYADISGIDVSLAPVYSKDWDSDDRVYWESHPIGEIKLRIGDEEVAKLFAPGVEFYLDFTLVDAKK